MTYLKQIIGKYSIKLSSLLLLALLWQSCSVDGDEHALPEETLSLQSSSTAISLDADTYSEAIINFRWTPARAVEADVIVSYRTKLDLEGNNFGAATVITRHEDDGIFEKSFSSEQLQNWAREKWGLPDNKPFTIQFRVIAQFEGGGTFYPPEVRTITVNVQPIRTTLLDGDQVFVRGTALSQPDAIEIQKTLENEHQYATLLQLQAGDLEIPVQYEGKTSYISASNGAASWQDGEAMAIQTRETAGTWNIPTAGQYRIVINLQKATAVIYSPAKALQPKQVQWNSDDGSNTSTAINDLWMHGAINNWGAPIKMDCTISLADPQVLIYQGGRTGKTKFIVYGGHDNNKNLAYAFSCPLTSAGAQQELSLTMGKLAELSGGASSAQRNAYYTLPTGSNFVVLDLRNMTILADKR